MISSNQATIYSRQPFPVKKKRGYAEEFFLGVGEGVSSTLVTCPRLISSFAQNAQMRWFAIPPGGTGL
jgi:hypothetical protein